MVSELQYFKKRCMYLWLAMSKVAKATLLSIASEVLSAKIRLSNSTSGIRRNRCNVSIITWSIGMNSKRGTCWQLFFLLIESFFIESIVPDTFVSLSLRGHSLETSCLTTLGQRHQMQAIFWFVGPMPQTVARNFQSPVKKNSNLKLAPAYVIVLRKIPNGSTS